MNHEVYEILDFGTKPGLLPMETVTVTINDAMFEDFAQAYVREAERVNPNKFNSLNLTIEEMSNYIKDIVAIRVQSCSLEGFKDHRIAKSIAIPAFIQYVISAIGTVTDLKRGLKFIIQYERKVDVIKMLTTSDKIKSLSEDGLLAVENAFPRTSDGDADLMNFVIIGDLVRAHDDAKAPIYSYLSAFLGMRLQDEATWKQMWRIPYDDVEFIKTMLMHERRIICQ